MKVYILSFGEVCAFVCIETATPDDSYEFYLLIQV